MVKLPKMIWCNIDTYGVAYAYMSRSEAREDRYLSEVESGPYILVLPDATKKARRPARKKGVGK